MILVIGTTPVSFNGPMFLIWRCIIIGENNYKNGAIGKPPIAPLNIGN
jgi:hypothetical protein